VGGRGGGERSCWEALVGSTSGCFSRPGFALFSTLMAGWVLAPGRRTITAIISVADPAGRRAHDAYHRFVRDGAWAMARLWRVLAVHAVTRFAPKASSPWTATTRCSTSRAGASTAPGCSVTRCAPAESASSTRWG